MNTMEEPQHLAQPSDTMLERNLGHLAKRGREIEVWIEGITDPKTGFIAGLDEEFLQMCLSKNASLSNVRRDMIVSLDETGLNIGNLIRDARGTPDEFRVERIREKINFFQKHAAFVLGKS